MTQLFIICMFVVFRPLEVLCDTFDHYDFTSKRVEWRKWLIAVLAVVAVSVAGVVVMKIFLDYNDSFGFVPTIDAITAGLIEIWQTGVLGELVAKILCIAAAFFGFKLFALALPCVVRPLLARYRGFMAHVFLD